MNQKDSVFKDLDLSGIIPLEIDTIFDAKAYLEWQLNSFSRSHVNDFGYISFAHSIFSIWGMKIGLESRGKKYREDNYFSNDFENFKTVFFKNKSKFKSLYKVLMPFYKQLFSEMTFQEQIAYLDVIKKGIEYSENFDLEREKKYVRNNNIVQSKGKIQAFIYRRIANKEMSKKECLNWLIKIQKDLFLVAKKEDKNESIVIEKDFAQYYSCLLLKYNYKYDKNGHNGFAHSFDTEKTLLLKNESNNNNFSINQLLNIVKSNLIVILQKVFMVNTVENLRLFKIFTKLLNRMLWMHGQGLWNCFNSTTNNK
jgi:hypothetical protein